jgi:malate dehydrogenase (oxaloacetate-decarboxylating)
MSNNMFNNGMKGTGKIEVVSRVKVENTTDLSLAYTPGVAEPCREIYRDRDRVYDYTSRGNLVAVVSNGTAVLGLGNIGPEAALPVMEGKAILFKTFAGIDAFPICLDTTDVEQMVEAVRLLEPTFGGVNLEDIAAPDCFEVESRLKRELQIPVFHDDQHGTAVVVMAALINALKLLGKELGKIKIVINGAGAAGVAITLLLLSSGARSITVCDRSGAIYEGRPEEMNPVKEKIARMTNRDLERGRLEEVIKGADVFIGVSAANVVTPEMVHSMAGEAIVMAMANPIPEIMPDAAKKAGARVVCTGRSDFPNQVNNVLAFPGIFRGALDVRATDINESMKIAAARAIAGLIGEKELRADYIIPEAFDPRVVPAVAAAVAKAARDSGVARRH